MIRSQSFRANKRVETTGETASKPHRGWLQSTRDAQILDIRAADENRVFRRLRNQRDATPFARATFPLMALLAAINIREMPWLY